MRVVTCGNRVHAAEATCFTVQHYARMVTMWLLDHTRQALQRTLLCLQADTEGGALQLTTTQAAGSGNVLSLAGCTFNDNSAGIYGGAVAVYGQGLAVTNSSFTANIVRKKVWPGMRGDAPMSFCQDTCGCPRIGSECIITFSKPCSISSQLVRCATFV
jgi:hypothetical protein